MPAGLEELEYSTGVQCTELALSTNGHPRTRRGYASLYVSWSRIPLLLRGVAALPALLLCWQALLAAQLGTWCVVLCLHATQVTLHCACTPHK